MLRFVVVFYTVSIVDGVWTPLVSFPVFAFIGYGYADGGHCQDIDPAACRLMADRDPHLCTNVALARTTCPEFCNLCPKTCYMCETPSPGTKNCNNTTVCGRGEHCYLKTVTSSTDDHVEYTMGCASPLQCDGVVLSQSSVIGKRDVTLTCCRSDLCNHPLGTSTSTTAINKAATTPSATVQTSSTTTSPTTRTTKTPAQPTSTSVQCIRDVLFMVPLTRTSSISNSHKLLDFIAVVINQFTVGMHDSLFAVASYGSDVHELVGFNAYRTVTELLTSLANDRVYHGNIMNHIDYNDVIRYVTNHRAHGDRPTVPTKTVIFVDHRDFSGYFSTIRHGHFPKFGDGVAVVTIGIDKSYETFSQLAADSNHRLHVSGYANMSSIESELVSLICAS